MSKLKVLNLSALSYSGTTWMNLLLGGHESVLTIGPPHRLWDARNSDMDSLCLVHGKACEFWPGFARFWDGDENLFVALHRYSGKSIFLMDNAPEEVINEALTHNDVELLTGRYLRDARAITASYARKMVDKGISYVDSIQPDGWFYHSFQAIPSLEDMNREGILVARYEEAANNQMEFLRNAGDFLQLTYSSDAQKFWEGDHHITSGNQGPIAMIKLFQGLPVGNFESRGVYEMQLARLKEDPNTAFKDERWKEQLTQEDLEEFDRVLGKKNELLGYPSCINTQNTNFFKRIFNKLWG